MTKNNFTFIIALMCLAIPGKVIEINRREAKVQYPSEIRRAMVGEAGIKPNDYVMVQMGIIVKVLSKKEAESALSAWNAKI